MECRDRPVDVERLAARFFAAEEVSALTRLPPQRRGAAFIACWTLKEACLKACGTGLRQPLRGIVFDPAREVRALRALREGRSVIEASAQPRPAAPRAGDGWRLALFADGGRHLVALALACAPGDLAVTHRRTTPVALAAAVEG